MHGTRPGGAHGEPGRVIAKGALGSGREFFQFHSDLMTQFFAWNAVHHAVAAGDIAAWNALPAELKLPETGWPTPWAGLNLADAEARINSNVPPFADDDALGIHVENTIHDWIHGAVAASTLLALPAQEKDIIASFHSVQSTYFYKIHGLVQYWWQRWVHPKTHVKEVIDVKHHVKDIVDTKPHVLDAPVPKLHVRETFDFGKLQIESFNPLQQLEQVAINTMMTRINELQQKSHEKLSPFIKPLMRPSVGPGNEHSGPRAGTKT